MERLEEEAAAVVEVAQVEAAAMAVVVVADVVGGPEVCSLCLYPFVAKEDFNPAHKGSQVYNSQIKSRSR